jgi:hypothetical protein
MAKTGRVDAGDLFPKYDYMNRKAVKSPEDQALIDKSTVRANQADADVREGYGKLLDQMGNKMIFDGVSQMLTGVVDGLKSYFDYDVKIHAMDKMTEIEDRKMQAAEHISNNQTEVALQVDTTRREIGKRAIEAKEFISRQVRMMEVDKAKIAGTTAERIARTKQIGFAFQKYFAGNPHVAAYS